MRHNSDEPVTRKILAEELDKKLNNYPAKQDLKNALENYPTKLDLENALKRYATKQDLKDALKGYATKTDLQSTVKPLWNQLLKLEEQIENSDEENKKYRDKSLTQLDKIVGELAQIREDRLFERDDLYQIQKRLTHLEQH